MFNIAAKLFSHISVPLAICVVFSGALWMVPWINSYLDTLVKKISWCICERIRKTQKILTPPTYSPTFYPTTWSRIRDDIPTFISGLGIVFFAALGIGLMGKQNTVWWIWIGAVSLLIALAGVAYLHWTSRFKNSTFTSLTKWQHPWMRPLLLTELVIGFSVGTLSRVSIHVIDVPTISWSRSLLAFVIVCIAIPMCRVLSQRPLNGYAKRTSPDTGTPIIRLEGSLGIIAIGSATAMMLLKHSISLNYRLYILQLLILGGWCLFTGTAASVTYQKLRYQPGVVTIGLVAYAMSSAMIGWTAMSIILDVKLLPTPGNATALLIISSISTSLIILSGIYLAAVMPRFRPKILLNDISIRNTCCFKKPVVGTTHLLWRDPIVYGTEASDYLDRLSLVRPSCDTIQHSAEILSRQVSTQYQQSITQTSHSFSVQGGYGTGKTWFLHQIYYQLDKVGYCCVYFNMDDPQAMEEHLLRRLFRVSHPRALSSGLTRKAVRAISHYLSSSVTINAGPVTAQLNSSTTLQHSSERNKVRAVNLERYKDDFQQALNDISSLFAYREVFADDEKQTPVIVFIDEIDRLSGQETLQLLKKQAYLDGLPCIFIVAMNWDRIVTTIGNLDGIDKPEEYLWKFIDDRLASLDLEESQLRDYIYHHLMHLTKKAKEKSSTVSLNVDTVCTFLSRLCCPKNTSLRDINDLLGQLEKGIEYHPELGNLMAVFYSVWMLYPQLHHEWMSDISLLFYFLTNPKEDDNSTQLDLCEWVNELDHDILTIDNLRKCLPALRHRATTAQVKHN